MAEMTILSASATPSIGWRWVVLAVCLGAWTLTNMDQSLFSYALPGILQSFHLPLEAAGVVIAVSFVCSSALVIVAGLLADRFGRGLLLCLLLGSSAVFVGLQGLAGGILTLTLFRSLGFGLSGGLSPITNALTVENAPDRLRGVSMGVLQCGYPLGWLLASLVAAPLLRDYGWRASCFAALGVVPLALLLGLLVRRLDGRQLAERRLTSPLQMGQGGRPGVRRLFAPDLRGLSMTCTLTFFLFGGAYAGSAFFFPTYFTQVKGYSPADAASLVGLSNGIAVIGYLGAALAGEYVLRRRTVFILWTIGGALSLLGLLWASHSQRSDLVWFALMATLFYGAMAVLPVLVAELFEQEVRATALGVCASAPLALGFAVFPLITPLMVGRLGWPLGLSLLVVPLMAIGSVAALFLPNRKSGLPIS